VAVVSPERWWRLATVDLAAQGCRASLPGTWEKSSCGTLLRPVLLKVVPVEVPNLWAKVAQTGSRASSIR